MYLHSNSNRESNASYYKEKGNNESIQVLFNIVTLTYELVELTMECNIIKTIDPALVYFTK